MTQSFSALCVCVETGDLVEGINGLAASVSALNVSIQQQGTRVQHDTCTFK